MTSSTIVGVDPGAHGAIAILDENGQLLGVEDMPTTPKVRAAVEFLEVELAAGAWHNSFNIEAKADAVGITIENLARARHKLGVESRQWPGTPRRWRLPDGEASR